MVFNPSPDGQHRWPLGAIVSENGYTCDHLACVCGEVPPVRYGGYMKDFGPNYIRGIMPGNNDSPDGYTWLVYSMNKEDIWAVRLPASLQYAETEPVHDHFDDPTGGSLERWYIYSPLWDKTLARCGAVQPLRLSRIHPDVSGRRHRKTAGKEYAGFCPGTAAHPGGRCVRNGETPWVTKDFSLRCAGIMDAILSEIEY